MKKIKLAEVFFLILLATALIFPVNARAETINEQQTDYVKKGIENLKAENYEEAVDDLKKARENDPSSSLAAYYLGRAYKKTQKYSEAAANFEDAVKLQPAVREAVIELADTAYHLGNIKQALENIEIAEREDIQPAQTAFLKGLVLLKAGKNIDAIDSFRKARDIDGTLATPADYQIGIANLHEGNLTRARDLFREIVVRDPDSNLAQFANKYIETITKGIKDERPFRATVGIQYQYDDNVLLKPGDSSVAAGITNEGDGSGIATLRTEYVPKLKGPYAIKAQYALFVNKHERLHSHDVSSHSVSLVPSYNFTNSSLSFVTNYNYTFVHDERYLQALGVSPTYALSLTENQFLQAFIKMESKDYLQPTIDSDENRDSKNYGTGIAWFYLIKDNQGFINVNYEFNREDTEGVNWRYLGNKIGLSLLYPLTDKLSVNIGGEGYLQDFADTHTIFNNKRKDETYTATAMLSYNVYDDMDVQLQYLYTHGASNIAVYDYDKNMLTAGVEVRF